MAWSALIHGAERDQIEATILEIAESLSAPKALIIPAGYGTPGARLVWANSLANGKAGVALFFAYLFEVYRAPQYRETAVRLLNEAIEAAGESSVSWYYYEGIAGIAWAKEQTARMTGSPCAECLEEIDLALSGLLNQPRWTWDYDLVHGLVGLVVYFLQRVISTESAVARDALEKVPKLLDGLSESSGSGITWRTNAGVVEDGVGAAHPYAYYNLGLAHGIPGIMVVLANLWQEGIRTKDTAKMLRMGAQWLLENKLPDGYDSKYAAVIDEYEPLRKSRLAWCYGDLGVAVALLRAGMALGDEHVYQEGILIAEAAANRHQETTGVVDAALCHGATGVAHIFNRLYQSTGNSLLAAASRRWFIQGLGMRKRNSGIAGFESLLPDRGGLNGWPNNPGILNGAAGIGLALLAAISNVAPAWDQMLLLDFPPKAP